MADISTVLSDIVTLIVAHACSGAGHHYAGGGQYKEGSSATITLPIALRLS